MAGALRDGRVTRKNKQNLTGQSCGAWAKEELFTVLSTSRSISSTQQNKWWCSAALGDCSDTSYFYDCCREMKHDVFEDMDNCEHKALLLF